MKLKKMGISLCLTAMASVIFNIGAAACTTPTASDQGAAAWQQVESPYARQRRQVQFPYVVGAAQKQQPKGSAFKAPAQKQQPKAPGAEELAQVQAQRQQINTLNKKVISLKTQARKDIGKICADLAKVAFDATVRQSQEYKTIVDTLNKVKVELADAEKIDYRAKLASVKGHNDSSFTLSGVITQLNTKISKLTAVVDELNDILSTADALVKQQEADQQSGQPTTSQPATTQPTNQEDEQKAAQQAWQKFLTQANAKKKTIDSNTQKITAVNKSCQDAVNEIVATAAANQDILADQGSAMADIVVQLGTVKTSLMAESNGKIAEALKAYDQDLKKKDYAGALDELDAIIGIQNNRISVVQSALSQLQSTLSSLKNLVATAAASLLSSSVSSQAA